MGKKKRSGFIGFSQIIVILLTGAMIAAVWFLNQLMIDVRLVELRHYLQQINRSDSGQDVFSLAMKYELYKRLYDKTITDSDFDIKELRMSFLSSSTQDDASRDVSFRALATLPALGVINGIRFLLGKESIVINESGNRFSWLDYAYYYERNKQYRRALIVYDEALEKDEIPSSRKSIVLLHQGFCYSIIGEYEKARSYYLGIIRDFNNEEIAITAAILLQYIDGFQREIDNVLQQDDSIAKTEKLFKLIAYNEAINVLERIESESTEEEKEKIVFYKGRCLEETGQHDEAIKNYQTIVMMDSKSEYAINANRRIMSMATTVEDGSKLYELAVVNNQLIEDEMFEVYTELYNDYHQKLKKSSIRGDLVDDTLLSKMKTEDSDQNREEFEKYIDEAKEKVTLEVEKYEKKSNKQVKHKKKRYYREKKSTKVYRDEFVYVRDSKGRITKSSYYGEDGIMQYYSIYEYVSDDAIDKITRYLPDGSLEFYTRYEYDEHGNRVSIKTFDKHGKLMQYY